MTLRLYGYNIELLKPEKLAFINIKRLISGLILMLKSEGLIFINENCS